jgi:hypothetical protein
MELIWKITGNTSYADKAVQICNARASSLAGIGCQNGSSHDYIMKPVFKDISLLMQQRFREITPDEVRVNLPYSKT